MQATHTPMTLEEIIQRKASLKQEIQNQKKIMTQRVHQIFSHLATATHKTNAIMRSFNAGMAVFDGFMTGIKIMRRIRRYFARFR